MAKQNGSDASKLTVPIVLVVAMLAMAGSSAWWLSGLSGSVAQINDTLGKMDRRMTNVEVNINAAFAEQTALKSNVAVTQERQASISERQNDMAARLLQLENWQRVMNARPQP